MTLLEKIVWRIKRGFYPKSTLEEIRRQEELLKLMNEEVRQYRFSCFYNQKEIEEKNEKIREKYEKLGFDFDKLS